MENFLLPTRVEFTPGAAAHTGEVVITPCFHGYGTTLGNALRRVLLSSLPGTAVEYFKVDGIQHEFSTVEGVKEDAVEMMLNLKQLAVRVFEPATVVLQLEKKGPGVVTAADFTPNASVEIVNKDLVIATLTKNKTLRLEVAVGHGRGYKPVEEKKHQNYDLGTMVVDSVYTPVRDVGYRVEYTRVGDITNYEKLVLFIETNGTISPQEAVRQSTQILMDHFSVILEAAQNAPAELVAGTPAAAGPADSELVAEAVADRAAADETSVAEPAAPAPGKEKKERKAKIKKTSKKKD